ncbi:hypothetical protein M3Y94_00664900 [Aphelenchoides besseyi]|nr:hypothetical protein M3Y94_00664900 [Aphelenchoides besseyi]
MESNTLVILVYMFLIFVLPLIISCSKKKPTNQKELSKGTGKTTPSPSGKKTPKSTSGKLETNGKIVELAKQKGCEEQNRIHNSKTSGHNREDETQIG